MEFLASSFLIARRDEFIDDDFAFLRFEEGVYMLDERGFAASRPADKGNEFPFLDFKRDIVKGFLGDFRFGVIGKGNVSSGISKPFSFKQAMSL